MTQTMIDILILFAAFFWQAYMQALIITMLFNIETTRTKNLIYSTILGIYGVISKLVIPLEYSSANTIIILILMISFFKFIYKKSLKESIVYSIILTVLSIPIELISSALLFNLFKFNTNVENVIQTLPLFLMIDIWFTIIALVICKIKGVSILKKLKDKDKDKENETPKQDTKEVQNAKVTADTETIKSEEIKANSTPTPNAETQNSTETTNSKENNATPNNTEEQKEDDKEEETPFRSSLYINIILIVCIISPNILFYTSNKYDYPLYLLLFNIIANIVLVVLSIYDTYKCVQLEKKKEALRISELHNKTLTELLDGIRTFKHDHANTIHAISGYLAFNDIDGLRKYFAVLDHDTKKNAQLESISPTKISVPSIYTLIATKYDVASKKDIFFRVETMYDYKKLAMPIYDFTKVLGVLIDNAIEAAEECEVKEINISFRRIATEQLQIFTIENTYKDKSVDTEKIFEKHYSTKNRNSGIGLWEVRNLVDRNVNVNIVTSKDEKYFTQRLFISEILLDD